MEKDIFDEKNFGEKSEMSSLTVDWGKVGDYIAGTFVRARHNIKTQFGANSIYEIESAHGSFHKLTKKVAAKDATIIEKGQMWSVWGRNDLFDGQMNSLRPGQVVKVMFTDEKTSQMGNDAKIIRIYAPKDNEGKLQMNQEWLDAQGVVGADM